MVCCCDSDSDSDCDDDEKEEKYGREGNFRRDRCGEVENGTGNLESLHRRVRGSRRRRNAETHNVDADNEVGGRHHKFRGHTAELKIMMITKNKSKNNDDDNNVTILIILAISRWTTN